VLALLLLVDVYALVGVVVDVVVLVLVIGIFLVTKARRL
jgi:hypothetical protein